MIQVSPLIIGSISEFYDRLAYLIFYFLQNWQQWYDQGSGSGNQASSAAIQPPPAK